MKRILAFTLIFAMLVTAMLGVMSSAYTINEINYETNQTPTLKITDANLEFRSTVYLLIAVNFANAGIDYDKDTDLPKADIKVDVTNKAGVTTTLTVDNTIERPDKLGAETFALFKYTGLAAKEMADTLTIRAYTDDKNNTNLDVADHTIEYSVLEYTIKAKAAKADAKLLNALDKMLAFGAAAQDAFGYEGDHALADENGAIDYGMVLVGGAATRKVIAPVGTDVNPTADSNTFKSAAKLYDMSFNEVAPSTLKVADGISRYFYYGKDLMGDYAKFSKAYGGATGVSNVTAINTADALGFNNLVFADASDMEDATAIATRLMLRMGRTDTRVGGVGTSFRALSTEYGWYLWVLRSHTGKKDTYSPDSTAIIKNGYMYVQTGNVADVNDYVSLTNPFTTSTYAMADSENKVTVTVALALSADHEGTIIRAGFSDAQNGNNASQVYGLSGVPKVELFNVDKNGMLYVGESQSYSARITELKKVDGEWSADDVTVVHFVMDMNRESITAYTADGTSVSIYNSTMAYNFFTNGTGAYQPIMDDIFNLQVQDGAAYISRITISSGDIFD